MHLNCLRLICAVIAMLAPMLTLAATIPVINEDFEAPFTGFTLQQYSTANATASIALGDVSGSTGLVFGGSWTVAPDPNPGESATGYIEPNLPTAQIHHLNPAEHEGITRVDYSADVILNGLQGDTLGNLFMQLLIYQQLPDLSFRIYAQIAVITKIENTTLQNVQVSLKREDFQDFEGKHPDFSPTANPLSFGLQLGAYFDYTAFTGTESGHLRADNWVVSVEAPDRLLKDGFEDPVP